MQVKVDGEKLFCMSILAGDSKILESSFYVQQGKLGEENMNMWSKI